MAGTCSFWAYDTKFDTSFSKVLFQIVKFLRILAVPNFNNMRLFQSILTLLFINVSAFAQEGKFDFYDTKKITEIKLTIKQPKYDKILDSMKLYGEGMIVGDVVIDGQTFKSVGIRYRGNSSYGFGNKRNPWHIKLNYVNKNQNYQGIKSIKLSNALRDPSMVREVLGYEIARKYMIAPRANYSKLYINGKYAGLYVNVESIDEEFVEKNYGSRTNTFFKCSPESNTKSNPGCKNKVFASLIYEPDPNCFLPNYTLKSETGWDELIQLTKTLADDPANIDKILDVDQTLWMLAFNNVFVNLSSYTGKVSQNYYLYKDNTGRFSPIIWDLNLCFGSYKNTGASSKDLTLKQMQELDPLLHINNASKPLISKLLGIKEYKLIYLAHMRQLYEENFLDGSFKARAIALQKQIRKPFIDDPYKYYTIMDLDKSLNSTVGAKSKIPGLIELMDKRVKFLRKHEQLQPVPSNVIEHNFKNRAKFDNNQVSAFHIEAKLDNYPKRAIVYYRSDDKSHYNTATLNDDGTNGDEKSGDGIYSGVINPIGQSTSLQYYIVTENAGAVGFYPADYMNKPLKISLEELNK